METFTCSLPHGNSMGYFVGSPLALLLHVLEQNIQGGTGFLDLMHSA